MKKLFSGITLALLLISTLTMTLSFRRVRATETIYIRADGSVDGTDKIVSSDNVTYTFTENIIGEIVVERSNIIIDGDGYTLQGSGSGYGLYLSSVYLSNVTVQNANIIGFHTGILIHYSFNNVIHGNIIANNSDYGIFVINSSYNLFLANILTHNYDGIVLWDSSDNNVISGNNITANWNGIVLFESPSNTISGNNILNNRGEGILVDAFGTISNLVVNNNKVIFNRKNGLHLSGYYHSYFYNVTVSSNMISSNGENGIYATAQNHYPETIFDLEISDNIISANRQKGICIEGKVNANLTRNSISYNTYGVFYNKTIDNSANYNDIYRNSYGMNVTNEASTDAAYNYWGNPSGPYHETLNVNGTGNPINGNGTDLDFIPFLTDPIGQINERPIAVLKADETTVLINDAVTFNASASTDDCQVDYYLFDFGDGTNSSWTVSPITMHEYTSGGIYNTTLIVIDNLGVTSIQTDLTYVTTTVLAPPTANFSYEPEHPFIDETIIFDASTSFDPDGTVESYMWDFGDGNITTTTDPIITHVYTSSGTYTLNLTITDNNGLNHSITKPITVIEDSIAPTTVHDYDGMWHTADFTITLTATDDFSGVAKTYYRINDGLIQNVTANGQPLITTEGDNNKLEYWSIDNADNEESHHILTGIKLDKTYPTIETPSRTPDGDVLPDQSVRVSVNVTDSASEVKNVTLSYTMNDDETWTELPMNHTASNLYEATIPPQEAGTTVRFRIVAYDHAGNNRTLNGTEPYCVYQVIPEFPPSLILPPFMTLTLLAVIFYRKKHQTLQNHI